MSENLFKYDRRAVRFEPVGIRWGKLMLNTFAVLVFSISCFLGADYIITHGSGDPEVARMVDENRTLTTYREKLLAEVRRMNDEVARLEETEASIYQNIYLNDRSELGYHSPLPESEELSHQDFTALADNTLEKARLATDASRMATSAFVRFFWPDKSDAHELGGIPAFAPTADFSVEKLACGFGQQINPFFKKQYHHAGLDILAETGTAVLATGNGRIVQVSEDDTPGGMGTSVVIEHGLGYQSRYARLASVEVRAGQSVRRGQRIAAVGMSGSSIAPHLHYEVLRYGRHVNPAGLMVGSVNGSDYTTLITESTRMRKALD